MDTRTICKEGICLFGGSRVRVCPAVVVTVADTFLSTGFPIAYFDLGKGNRMVDEIKALKELLDMGAITQEDFDRKKAELLGCAAEPNPQAQQPTHRSQPVQPPAPKQKNKATAAILARLLGLFGAHKFYLGYTMEGVIMLLTSILGAFLLCLGPLVMAVISGIEEVTYLSKSDADFEAVYVRGRKGWF